MMSFVKTSLLENTKKLYLYKTRSFVWVLSSLMIIQVLGILFSLFPTSSYGSYNGLLSLNSLSFSANPVFISTLLWIFLVSVQITSVVYKENEFMFIVTRKSNLFSDALFIFTISGISTVTVLLADLLLRNVHYFIFGIPRMSILTEELTFAGFTKGVVASYLIIALFGMLAYLFGLIVQYNKIFMVIIPGILFAILAFGESLSNYFNAEHPVMATFNFYFMESNFGFFLLKYVITIAISIVLALFMSKRLEVRR